MGLNNTDENKAKLMSIVIAGITDEAKIALNKELKRVNDEVSIEIAKLNGIIAAARDSAKDFMKIKPCFVNFGSVEKPNKKIVHQEFDKVIRILQATKRKEKNVMLVGEAGGGKTQLCENIAEALNLPFYPMSVGLQTTKSDLLGFIDAHGSYKRTIIREAFENGGLLLLDEFDCAHAGVVTILNSMLANGFTSFPDKVVKKHPNFICICACNTFGRGATVDYVGRNRLDAATLDRFVFVEVGYDISLENMITRNDLWHKLILDIRKNIAKHGIRHIVSPRASMDGADLIDAGFSVKDALALTVFKGVNLDMQERMLSDIDIPSDADMQAEQERQKGESETSGRNSQHEEEGNADGKDGKDEKDCGDGDDGKDGAPSDNPNPETRPEDSKSDIEEALEVASEEVETEIYG